MWKCRASRFELPAGKQRDGNALGGAVDQFGGRAVSAGSDQRPQNALGVPLVGLHRGGRQIGQQLRFEALLSEQFGQPLGPGVDGFCPGLRVDQDHHPIGLAGHDGSRDDSGQSWPPQAVRRCSRSRRQYTAIPDRIVAPQYAECSGTAHFDSADVCGRRAEIGTDNRGQKAFCAKHL